MSLTACRLGTALGAAGVCLFAVASPALAADLAPAPESVNWTGFYVGGQLGGDWSDSDWRYHNRNWFNTDGPELLGTNFGFDDGAVIGGGQVGFNYQSGAWVLGVEGSVARADLSDSRPSPFFPTIDRYSSDISWLATVTGRLGYARDRWLVYAKGGWAGADVELTLFDRFELVRANSGIWANGWTVGGGAEYALGRSFSLGVEYDYADLGTGRLTTRCNCPGGVGGGTPVVDADIAIQSVTARLNYRFGN
ncbi:MAG: outer membrane protein [Methyloceanibacter sp.]